MGFKKFLDKELQKSRDAEMRKEEEKHAAETRLTMEKFEEDHQHPALDNLLP